MKDKARLLKDNVGKYLYDLEISKCCLSRTERLGPGGKSGKWAAWKSEPLIINQHHGEGVTGQPGGDRGP